MVAGMEVECRKNSAGAEVGVGGGGGGGVLWGGGEAGVMLYLKKHYRK